MNNEEQFLLDYLKYIQTAEKTLSEVAKRQGVGSFRQSNPENNLSFSDLSRQNQKYQIQSALSALAILLETKNNVCVAVAMQQEKLYIADNKSTFESNVTRKIEKIKNLLDQEQHTEQEIAELAPNTIAPETKIRLMHTIRAVSAVKDSIKNSNIVVCTKSAGVHAEVAVINRITSERPWYLGISRTCCPKCTAYLLNSAYTPHLLGNYLLTHVGQFLEEEECRALLPVGIFYRESHDNAAPGWLLPQNDAKQLKRAIGKELYQKYVGDADQARINKVIEWIEKFANPHITNRTSRRFSIPATSQRNAANPQIG